jgi:hypothetical protein
MAGSETATMQLLRRDGERAQALLKSLADLGHTFVALGREGLPAAPRLSAVMEAVRTDAEDRAVARAVARFQAARTLRPGETV